MNRLLIKVPALITISLLVLSACSSSSLSLNEEESGGPTEGGTIGSGGGIGGTGVLGLSFGTLTAFGSIVINGERFDTSSSSFTINGQSAAQDQLQIGMQLAAAVNFETLSAADVTYNAIAKGPLQNAPDNNGQFVILGQQSQIDKRTILDNITLPELVAGTPVEISGVRNADNVIIVSYLRRSPDSSIQIIGQIDNVDDTESFLSIGALTVRINQLQSAGVLQNSIGVGQSVLVRAAGGQYDMQASTLIADLIEPVTSQTGAEQARIELTGFVQSFTDNTLFSVGGFTINTDQNTLFSVPGQSSAMTSIQRNSLAEIEGQVVNGNTVLASRVLIIPTDNVEITAAVEDIDSGNGTLTILGMSVQTTALTRFRNDKDSSSSNFSFIGIGDIVEIDAAFIEDTLIASKIESEDADEDVELEGPVTRIDGNQGQIDVAGITVTFDSDTEFEISQSDDEQEVGSAQFLQTISIGSIIEVKWDQFTSLSDPVSEIELDVPGSLP